MLKLTRADTPESLVTLATKHLLCQAPAQCRSEHLERVPALTEHSLNTLSQRWGMAGAYQEGTGKSGSYGMWNHPRGHVWNVFVRPASS